MRKKDRRAGFVVSGEFILGKKGEGSHLSYAKGRKSWAEPEVTFPDPSRRFFSLSRPIIVPSPAIMKWKDQKDQNELVPQAEQLDD